MIALALFFQVIIFAQTEFLDNISTIQNTLVDLKQFCLGKTDNFCSKESISMSRSLLKDQLESVKQNIIHLRKEQRRREKLHKLNQLKYQRMANLLREHFLDRHL